MLYPLAPTVWLALTLQTLSDKYPTTGTGLFATASLIPTSPQLPFWHNQQDGSSDSLAASYAGTSQRSQVAGEKVIRIAMPEKQEEAEELMRELEERGHDIWQAKRDHVDVRVSHAYIIDTFFKRYADRTNVLIPSIADLLSLEHDQQSASISTLSTRLSTQDPDTGIHSIYHPLSGIESLLKLFTSDYPDFVRLEEIGKSFEGKSIYSLSVSDYRESRSSKDFKTWREYSPAAARKNRGKGQSGEGKARKKLGFALLGGQHAREWISPAAILYLMHNLLVQASAAPSALNDGIHTALQDFEFHFIPVPNPDGYQYSWESDRLWVKNRQYTSSNESRCHGIDLNRNWAYMWEKSARPNPCSDMYPGSKAFEAVELEVVSEYLKRINKGKGLQVFVDVHSFGQMLMYPYAASCSMVPPDAENLYESLLGASKAIRSVHKQRYDVGSVCDVSYTATGQSLDWTYHAINVKWSFSVNLRDQGVYAFLLPPDHIVETGQEFMAGILDLAEFIAKKEKIED